MCNKKVYVQDNILPQPPKKLHRLGLQPDPAWVTLPSLGYFIQLGQLSQARQPVHSLEIFTLPLLP